MEEHPHQHHRDERPYWKRAHLDWRLWVAALLMIAAMFVYIMTDDFSMRFRRRPPQSETPGSVRTATSILPMPLLFGSA